jgi:hypothetical protein
VPKKTTSFTDYLDKEPTPLQARFPDWLVEKVGITFGTAKEMAAFREGVRLSTALRIPFQASPENRAARDGATAKKTARPAAAAAEPATKATRKAAVAKEKAAGVKPARRPRSAAATGSASPF